MQTSARREAEVNTMRNPPSEETCQGTSSTSSGLAMLVNAANARASITKEAPTNAGAKRRLRGAAVAGAVVILALTAACSNSKGGSTTCQEYASLSPDTGLLTQANSAQEAVLRKMLQDHDKSTKPTNLILAETQVVAYCNIFGGRAGSNADQPIENIPGLR